MIVVAGEALMDLLIDRIGAVHASPGGGPYNVARAIGRLGVDCRYLGHLSADRFGSILREALDADGVGVVLGDPCPEPTTLAAAELDDAGGATYRFYLAGTSAPRLSPADVADVALARDDAVHVGSLALVVEPLASTLLGWLGSLPAGAMVMADLNCRPYASGDAEAYRNRLRRAIALADVVKASTEDLDFLAPNRDPSATAAEIVHGRTKAVLLTAGKDPVRVVHRRGTETVAVASVEVVDTVGAGDAFGGGFLAWWVDSGRGRDALDDTDALERAAAVGCSVAAITCGRAGADPPHRADVAQW